MTIDTVETEPRPAPLRSHRGWVLKLTLYLGLTAAMGLIADPALGPWLPLFQGIDHQVATNDTRGTDFVNLMVANVLRVDLQAPGVQFLASPRIDNYAANSRETAGMTVSRFVKVQGVQAAVNAGFFRPSEYYLPEGTPMAVSGLLISQGEPVSPASSGYSASLYIDAANHAQIFPTNFPAASTNDIWTAVSGDYPVLVNGVNIGRKYLSWGGIHDVNPRTAIGLSQDRRYLYLVTIDGRQPGYSNGAWDFETAAWLQVLGAHDGINMDGGGSSTMSIQDVTGNPRRLNRPSAVADSGRERTVGGHLGVFALPLEGFINQVVIQPDDDAASITWNTLQPASTQVEYGLTPDLGSATPANPAPALRHAVRLTGLQPGTGYYLRAVSAEGSIRHTSPDLYFTTLTYLTTNEVVTLTNEWKYTAVSLDDQPWTAPGFDDSGWSGPGPALLWVDTRTAGPNPEVQPRGTEMAFDAATGFPFTTYYFRTHFTLSEKASGTSLFLSGLVDDGAVFYLNGTEIRRLRMDETPLPIANASLAIGYPCDGDATCQDEFTVSPPESDALVAGDNVLAVEVHNYNPRSADITFGMSVVVGQAISVAAQLDIAPGVPGATLTWTRGGFLLQQADSLDGPWTDTPGPVVSSPYLAPHTDTPRYYRLIK